MVSFPNCKINLGLHILGKRKDGYHDLQTIFYPLPFSDALEVVHHPDQSVSAVFFTQTGGALDIPDDQNICVKAWHLLKKDFQNLPATQMHLHKQVPSGAGLGGGSADGAFALRLLNQKFQLQLSSQQLIQYALQLGSDCPFFIMNQTCLATGRGEIMEQVKLDLSAYQIIVVNPGIHIATSWAFAQLKQKQHSISLKEVAQRPVETWQMYLTNDFEEPVFHHFPVLKNIKENLLQQGAVYASMTGTGSTVFGIFRKEVFPDLNFAQQYFTKSMPAV